MKLEIELVPGPQWDLSLRKLLPRKIWNEIRNEIIEKQGRKCQICGSTEGRMSLHEIWEYDDEKHVQTLTGFQLLCNLCHFVKHIGFAGILAREGKLDYDEVVKHFCRVNNCSVEEFMSHKDEAFEIWAKRNRYKWKQDFGEYKEFIKQ